MGQLSYSSIGRSFLFSEALGIEGKEQIAKLVPPAPRMIAADPATLIYSIVVCAIISRRVVWL
jgi:hypothetical protein